jgi:hypothetical protein
MWLLPGLHPTMEEQLLQRIRYKSEMAQTQPYGETQHQLVPKTELLSLPESA